MRLLLNGYLNQPITVVSSIEIGFNKIKEWNPNSISELPFDTEDVDTITLPVVTIATTTKDDGTKIRWWVKSIGAYL